MKNINTHLLLFISFIILFACQKEIDFEKEFENNKTILNSFIASDSTIKVSLSKDLYINEFKDFETVKNAKVLLFENNKFIEQLQFEELHIKNIYSEDEGQPDTISKFYYTSKAKVNAGMHYRIEVEENSETIIKAETYIPNPVQISSIDTFVTFTDWGRWIDIRLHFNIHFNDLAEETNYYRIGMKYHTGYLSKQIQEEDTISYIKTLHDVRGIRLSDYDPVLSTENKDANSILFGAIDNTYTIFSDEKVNGQDCNIEIALRYFNYDGTTVPFKEELGEFLHIKLQLHSLSEDAYLYLSSIDKQFYNDDLPFVEPVPIYSNIENGNGIFAGYSVSEMELKIGEYPMEGIEYVIIN